MLDNQKKIANKVYANRMGNGDEKGEPSKFIGRGALQLTGKNNYKLFSDFIGEDCVKIQIWLQLNTFSKC
jgi:putative chitinase